MLKQSRPFADFLGFIIALIGGFYILMPFINFQQWLSQGDHGLMLYGIDAVGRGELPYRDFLWFYGPLMLYFYLPFYHLFGQTILGVLVGNFVINLSTGLLIFSTLRKVVPTIVALTAAFWFWTFHQDFFYTYNHIGGICLMMAVFLFFLKYLLKEKYQYLYIALILCFILGLIKLNIGVSVCYSLLGAFLVTKLFKRQAFGQSDWLIIFWSALLIPALIIGSYVLLVWGLPFEEIRQCLHYFGNDAMIDVGKKNILDNLFSYYRSFLDHLKINVTHIYLWFVATLGVIVTIVRYYQHFLNPTQKDRQQTEASQQIINQDQSKSKSDTLNIIILFLSLIIFWGLNMHEFLLSGVPFRAHWVEPIVITLLFVCIGALTLNMSIWLRWVIVSLIMIIHIMGMHHTHQNVNKAKTLLHYFNEPQAQVFLGNSPGWINTVSQATQFLKENMAEDETFFALPYDPLYYYLAGKKSPTRMLAFFDFLRITDAQESRIIYELKNEQINWVVLSNRFLSKDVTALGVYGESYGRELKKYIDAHFEEVVQFGVWSSKPSWAWNHGVKIYKRTSW